LRAASPLANGLRDFGKSDLGVTLGTALKRGSPPSARRLHSATGMTNTLSNNVRHALLTQHVVLEGALKDLNDSAMSMDPRPLQAAWATFESNLLRHLELEENTIIPLFAATNPDEAHRLLSEHDRIRDVVFELGLRCDLHAVRKAGIDRLARMLRSHAEYEDATLYRWVEEHATIDTRRHLLSLLVKTLRSELHAEGVDERAPASRSA